MKIWRKCDSNRGKIVVKFHGNNKIDAEEGMRKSVFYSSILVFLFSGLTGCSGDNDKLIDNQQMEISLSEETEQKEEASTHNLSQTQEMPADAVREAVTESIIEDMDWSNYFDGINGTAVIYEPIANRYQIYNQELSLTRRSPCSTFKIISSLIALENGIIKPNESTRTWSGEIFWNEDWNRDIDFCDAFRTSCVWYFREIIDEIGKDVIQKKLDELEYGNGDISDWEGRLNTNNNNPVLTGFWIESSLLISPKEQAEVMERIFGDNTDYSEEILTSLKQVMLLPEQNSADISIYGKTGMGKANGIVIDSWYTGFADVNANRIYFCVYLGETDNENVSSARAKEIALKIISDFHPSE